MDSDYIIFEYCQIKKIEICAGKQYLQYQR